MALSQEHLDNLELIMETRKAENKLFNKIDMIKVAKDILIENSRNSPVNERNITVEEIVSMANSLISFVNS